MHAAIVILEILVRAEMQLRDDSDTVNMSFAYQVYVVGIARFVDYYIDMALLTEMVDEINVALRGAFGVWQEEAIHIVLPGHTSARHVVYVMPSAAQSMRHIVCHALRAPAARIDLRNEVKQYIHRRSNL